MMDIKDIADKIETTIFAKVLYAIVTEMDMKDIIEVKGDKEKLAEVAQWFTSDTDQAATNVYKAMTSGLVTLKPEKRPHDRVIYALRIPPYYLFIDTGENDS